MLRSSLLPTIKVLPRNVLLVTLRSLDQRLAIPPPRVVAPVARFPVKVLPVTLSDSLSPE